MHVLNKHEGLSKKKKKRFISGLSVGFQQVISGLSQGYQRVPVGYQRVIIGLSEGYQRVIRELSVGGGREKM